MKIAILSPYGQGDIAISTSVLRYRDELWPGAHIIWLTMGDSLKENNLVDEIRPWCFQRANDKITWREARGKQNGLSDKGKLVKELSDVDKAYFPLPWMNQDLMSRMRLADVARTVFGIPAEREWHPCMYFSKTEEERANKLIDELPFKKTIMMETRAGSGQSPWNDSFKKIAMATCKETFGECNFIFASKNPDNGIEGPGIVSLHDFTVRQCIPVYNRVDLFIGVSSGISCATCSWSANKNVPRIEVAVSEGVSTRTMSRGKYERVTTTDELSNAIRRIEQ